MEKKIVKRKVVKFGELYPESDEWIDGLDFAEIKEIHEPILDGSVSDVSEEDYYPQENKIKIIFKDGTSYIATGLNEKMRDKLLQAYYAYRVFKFGLNMIEGERDD